MSIEKIERTPQRIIGNDAYVQLVFEGYEVVKADELSRLREVERRAKEVIRPFADEASEDNGEYRIDWKHDDDREIVGSMFCDLTFGHFRAARDFYRALSEREGQDG